MGGHGRESRRTDDGPKSVGFIEWEDRRGDDRGECDYFDAFCADPPDLACALRILQSADQPDGLLAFALSSTEDGSIIPAEKLAVGSPSFPGFTIVRKIGEGAFACVYLARDEKLKREAALKVLSPRRQLESRARELVLKEARSLARIRHPNVLTIYAVLEHGEWIGLATELVKGQTLDHVTYFPRIMGRRFGGFPGQSALASVVSERDAKEPKDLMLNLGQSWRECLDHMAFGQ